MIKSMTAYGRGDYSDNDRAFTVEIKSLNNRFKDIVLRFPNALQAMEDEIRSIIASRIQRGRIEVSIKFERIEKNADYGLELNLPLIRSHVRIFRQLNEELGLDEKIRPEYLLQVKDAILYKPVEEDLDALKPGLQKALNQALDSLEEMRIIEGQAIEKDFLKRLNLIQGYLDQIEKRSPLVVEEYRTKLRDKINTLTQEIQIDETRLAQEVTIFASRCDITEEIVRTKSHLKQFRDYMSLDDSIGRRLDFLIQEMNREVNTMSSKASDSSISINSVEIKSELEKLREQTQNVE
ncbi:MAG: YicC family protein [Deltaproteobacteria bacterium]|nr:YicC family protein [Deltaproteobacteria bacterium]